MSLLAALVAACAAGLSVWAWAVRSDGPVAAVLPAGPTARADEHATAEPGRIVVTWSRAASVLSAALGVPAKTVTNSCALATCGAAAGLLAGDLVSAGVLTCLGSVAPVLWVRRMQARRRAALDAQVPQLLDALAGAASAGLSVPNALRRAMPAVRGPLAIDLASVVDRVAMGSRWRDELQALAERCGSHDMGRAVATLSRAEALGSPLAATLVELADEVRAIRGARMAERARRAPVKMLFPLVFLVLPAFLLLTVVPVLLSTIRSIG